MTSETHYLIRAEGVGEINVFVEGLLDGKRTNVVTVHDLGCSHKTMKSFVDSEHMASLRQRCTFIHIDVPGQEDEAPDLPANFKFPTMKALGRAIKVILEELKVKSVVGLGEGAGANILARFALEYPEFCLGICLIHCTSTTAGFMEVMKDKVLTWKLDHIGMDPSVENYLVLHRFGASHLEVAKNASELDDVVKDFCSKLYSKRNPKNLKLFVEAFKARTELTARELNLMKTNVLLVTGKEASFNHTVHTMYSKLDNKNKATLLEISAVANPLSEAQEKLAEGLQYFVQGLGLISSIPMRKISGQEYQRARRQSMEEMDRPRKNSTSLLVSTPRP